MSSGIVGWDLPRGRHRLPQEVVRAHQHQRMVAGLAEAAAERGISELRVSDVLSRSKVSRATFYQQFGGLDDCLVSSYRDVAERLIQGISAACGSAPDWPHGVLAALDFSIEFGLAAPAQAQLVTATNNACDPRLHSHSRLVLDQLAGLLRRGRQEVEPAPFLPDLTEAALIGGAIAVVGSCLASATLDRLPGLRPELGLLLLTPYLGRKGAGALIEQLATTTSR